MMPYETEFLHTFSVGMLYTRGLRSTGGAHRDSDEWHPLHGRCHSLQAEQAAAYAEADVINIRSVLRETALFGHNLELTRTIRIPIFGAEVTVKGSLINRAHVPEECAMLYHCKFGWPMVCKESEVLLPESRRTSPCTEFAATGMGQEHPFTEPVPGEEERGFPRRYAPYRYTPQPRAGYSDDPHLVGYTAYPGPLSLDDRR